VASLQWKLADETAAREGAEAQVAGLEAKLAAAPVSIEEANQLQDILRTLTNSGTALKTSARELVAKLAAAEIATRAAAALYDEIWRDPKGETRLHNAAWDLLEAAEAALPEGTPEEEPKR